MGDASTPSASELAAAFRGELTEREFRRVQSALLPFWARAYVLAPACVFVFIAIGVGWPAVFADPLAAFPELFFGLMVLVFAAFITWRSRRKQWQTNAQLHGQVSGQLTARGLEWNTSTTKAEFPWSKLTHFTASEELVLIFFAPRCAFYFPKSFFATDDAWHSFKGLLATHLSAKRSIA